MSEVEIKIKGDDDSESAFRKARNNEERLAAAAKEAGIDLTVMGRKGEEAGKITAAGADNARAGVRRLNAGIGELNRGITVLREEFERTGDVDFLRQGKRLTAARKGLEGFKNELTTLRVELDKFDKLDKIGVGFGAKIGAWVVDGLKAAGGQITDAWSGIWKSIGNNPVVSTVLLTGVLAATPILIATVSSALGSAVELGLGGGVIALGISRAIADSRVSAAWSAFGKSVSKELDSAAGVFVQPLISAESRVKSAFDELMPSIAKGFHNLAPDVDRLAQGFAGMVHNLAPGFDEALNAAEPFISLLADHLPDLGSAMNSFLGHIANAGPGLQMFFDDLLTATEQGIRALGWLIEKGSELYQVFVALGQAVTGDVGGAWDTITHIGDKSSSSFNLLDKNAHGASDSLNKIGDAANNAGLGVQLASADFQKLSGQISATAQTTDVLAGAMTDKIINTTMSLDQAILGVAESETRLSAAIDNNGRALDIHTEKGQANREAVLAVVAANLRQYDSLIAAGVSAEDAAAAYDQNTAALERQLRAAGFTADEVKGLVGQYRTVPDRVNTTIAMEGLTAAISGLDETLRLINHLPARKQINVDVIYNDPGYRDAQGNLHRGGVKFYAHGGVVGAAAGGIRSGLTAVGERGFELMELPPGTTVHSHEDSQRMLSAANQSGGVATIQLEWVGGNAGDEFMTWLRKNIRIRGGLDAALR